MTLHLIRRGVEPPLYFSSGSDLLPAFANGFEINCNTLRVSPLRYSYYTQNPGPTSLNMTFL